METLLSSSEFGQIRAFIAVSEARSFSRAAAMLGVSSSALSQTIRTLEERIGVRLINRTTRSVSLSEAGAALFQRLGPAIGELAAAIGQAKRYGEHPAGVVRIHAFRVAADLFLKPMLRSFHEAYPDIVLDITLDDQVVDIVAGGFDAAIRVGEVIERDLIAVKLGSDLRQVAVASPGYLAEHGVPATPRDLSSHSCIGWRWQGRDRPYAWEFSEGGKWFEVSVNGPVVSNNRELGIQAAIDGLGNAFAIEEVVAPHIAEERLVPLLKPWSAPFPGFYLCYPAQRQMAPTLRAFIDAAVDDAKRRRA